MQQASDDRESLLEARHAMIVRDHVSVIEVNHFYDDSGGLVFDQAIFYRWNRKTQHYDVVDWRLLKPGKGPRHPFKDHRTNIYKMSWFDSGILRAVTSESFRESWTQYDPELVERKFVPKDRRVGLSPLFPR